MESCGEVAVILTDELIDHLYRLSYEADIPLRWLVAGIICDTMETAAAGHQSSRPITSMRAAGYAGVFLASIPAVSWP
jgi:hypothetical protein